jgi:hypothetical protein
MGLQRCCNPRSLQYVMSGSGKLEVIVPDFDGVKVCFCLCARARYAPTVYTYVVHGCCSVECLLFLSTDLAFFFFFVRMQIFK